MDTFNIKKLKKDVNTTYLHVLIYLCELLFFLALFIFAVAQKMSGAQSPELYDTIIWFTIGIMCRGPTMMLPKKIGTVRLAANDEQRPGDGVYADELVCVVRYIYYLFPVCRRLTHI